MKKEESFQKISQLEIGLYYFNESIQIHSSPPTNLITCQICMKLVLFKKLLFLTWKKWRVIRFVGVEGGIWVLSLK